MVPVGLLILLLLLEVSQLAGPKTNRIASELDRGANIARVLFALLDARFCGYSLLCKRRFERKQRQPTSARIDRQQALRKSFEISKMFVCLFILVSLFA